LADHVIRASAPNVIERRRFHLAMRARGEIPIMVNQ
jgi:hypothetical protein